MPCLVRWKLQAPRARVEPGSDAQHDLDSLPRDGLDDQVIQEAGADPDAETHQPPAGDTTQDRIAAGHDPR